MSMNSEQIKEAFKNLDSFETYTDKIELNASLLSSQYVSHIIEVMEKNGIKRKFLAEMIGTSSSYITQVFRGNKLLNFITLAKIQDALSIGFKVQLDTQKNLMPSISRDLDEIMELQKKYIKARFPSELQTPTWGNSYCYPENTEAIVREFKLEAAA